MKAKLLICAVLLLGAVGGVATSFLQQDDATFNVAERVET